MGENHDFKVQTWKRTVESNKSAILLLSEIKEKQVPPREENDMDVEVNLDLGKESLKHYKWYHPRVFEEAMEHLKASKDRMGEHTLNNDVLEATLEGLKGTNLLTKICFDW